MIMNHEKFTASELEKKANDIMLAFDFEKVRQHMLDNDWKWIVDSTDQFDTEPRMEVPSVDRLKTIARSLLTQAIWSETPVTNVGTGGFVAYKLPWGLSLTFQIQWNHA